MLMVNVFRLFGDGRSCLTMAYLAMGEWFKCGYTSEQCEVRYENY